MCTRPALSANRVRNVLVCLLGCTEELHGLPLQLQSLDTNLYIASTGPVRRILSYVGCSDRRLSRSFAAFARRHPYPLTARCTMWVGSCCCATAWQRLRDAAVWVRRVQERQAVPRKLFQGREAVRNRGRDWRVRATGNTGAYYPVVIVNDRLWFHAGRLRVAG